MEVCLVYDALDVWHTDLKRMVFVLLVPEGIEPIPQLCGDQSFAVKFQNFDVRRFLYAGIAAHRRVCAVVLYGDGGDIRHDAARIVHHNDVVGVHVKAMLYNAPAGKHQSLP